MCFVFDAEFLERGGNWIWMKVRFSIAGVLVGCFVLFGRSFIGIWVVLRIVIADWRKRESESIVMVVRWIWLGYWSSAGTRECVVPNDCLAFSRSFPNC